MGSNSICWINLEAEWLFFMCIIQMIVPKLLSSFFLFLFWPLRLACRILDLDQWLNPGPTTGRVLRPNHYTARELPTSLLFAWPRKTFSVVKRRPDFVLEFQCTLHLGSKGVVWTCLKPVLDKQQKEEEWVMGIHGRNWQLHLPEMFQRTGPQSLCEPASFPHTSREKLL